ncbi:hypothetical protein EJ04DRAFT_410244, partial [Polyplosphaeria fusca]
GLVSLQSIIVNQDAQSLDERNHIHFLTAINNEAKVRRSTKREVLGKAKVMGFDQ